MYTASLSKSQQKAQQPNDSSYPKQAPNKLKQALRRFIMVLSENELTLSRQQLERFPIQTLVGCMDVPLFGDDLEAFMYCLGFEIIGDMTSSITVETAVLTVSRAIFPMFSQTLKPQFMIEMLTKGTKGLQLYQEHRMPQGDNVPTTASASK